MIRLVVDLAFFQKALACQSFAGGPKRILNRDSVHRHLIVPRKPSASVFFDSRN